MDSWILKGVKTLVNEDTSVNVTSPTQVKVKVSYLLLTDFDEVLFSGATSVTYPRIPGRVAVGIVTEAGENCYGVEKGMRVFFRPSRACGKCLACKSGNPKDCTSVLIAGKDFDGFMRDFVVCEYNEVTPIPDAVDAVHALCIESIGIAENIYDRLNLSAGQRVAVIGADFSANIIAQVLQYHKVTPIVIDNNAANQERAAKCDIHYVFAADDELESNVISATCGNFCDAAVYCATSQLPLTLTTRLVGKSKPIVICCQSSMTSTIPVRDVLDKNLTICGISNAYLYEDAVINMLLHGAVNIDCFEKQILTEFNPAQLLAERCGLPASKKDKMQILKMIL